MMCQRLGSSGSTLAQPIHPAKAWYIVPYVGASDAAEKLIPAYLGDNCDLQTFESPGKQGERDVRPRWPGQSCRSKFRGPPDGFIGTIWSGNE